MMGALRQGLPYIKRGPHFGGLVLESHSMSDEIRTKTICRDPIKDALNEKPQPGGIGGLRKTLRAREETRRRERILKRAD